MSRKLTVPSVTVRIVWPGSGGVTELSLELLPGTLPTVEMCEALARAAVIAAADVHGGDVLDLHRKKLDDELGGL